MTFSTCDLITTGRSRVIRNFSSRSQSKTSWPPLMYCIFKGIHEFRSFTCDVYHNDLLLLGNIYRWSFY